MFSLLLKRYSPFGTDCRFFAVGCSLLLSWYLSRYAVLNSDGYFYFFAAEAFADSGLKASMKIFSWPFFPVSLSLLADSFSITLESAALLFNAVIYASLVALFISLVRHLNSKAQFASLAMIIILLYPHLNNFRPSILRDAPYWLLLLSSLWLLWQYSKTPKWYYAFYWQLSLLLAALYRLEGLIFLATMPLLLLGLGDNRRPWPQRLRHSFALLLVPIILALSLLLYQNLCTQSLNLGRLPELMAWLKAGPVRHFITPLSAFTKGWLQLFGDFNHFIHYPKPLAYLMSFLILSSYLVFRFISSSHLFNLIFIYFSRKNIESVGTALDRRILAGYLLVQLIIVATFFFHSLFVSLRYVMPLSLMLLLFAPFGLANLIESCRRCWAKKKKWPAALLFAMLLVLLVDSTVSMGPSKYYYRQAGEWLKQQIGPHQTIFFSNSDIAYYAGYLKQQQKDKQQRLPIAELPEALAAGKFCHYNYFALDLRQDHPLIKKKLLTQFSDPIYHNKNNRGDEVYIFKQKPCLAQP